MTSFLRIVRRRMIWMAAVAGLVAACTTGTRSTGRTAGTLEVTFSTDPSSGAFAVAEVVDDGSEFAFFADVGTGDATSINTRLANGVIVKMSLDALGRPVKIVGPEESATVEYQAGTAKVIVVVGDQVSETDIVLPESVARVRTPVDPTALQAGSGQLCSQFRTYVLLMDVLFACSPGDLSLRCSPVFTQLAATTQHMCTDIERVTMAPPDDLGPFADEAPLVPLRGSATAELNPDATGVDVDLTGTAEGGSGGYTFIWRVIVGPTLPIVADGQQVSLRVSCPGDYLIRLIVVDSEGQRDGYLLPLTVEGGDIPGTRPVPRFLFPDRDLVNPEVVPVLANLRDCNDDAQWQLSALYTPAGSTGEPEVTVLETGSGNVVGFVYQTDELATGSYVLSLSATDSGLPVAETIAAGARDSIVTVENAFTITVLDGLAPVVSAGDDQTVAGGAMVTLSCSQVGGDAATSFGWDQVGQTTVALSNADTATATFVAPTSPATLSFQCDGNNQFGTGTDVVTITVQP